MMLTGGFEGGNQQVLAGKYWEQKAKGSRYEIDAFILVVLAD